MASLCAFQYFLWIRVAINQITEHLGIRAFLITEEQKERKRLVRVGCWRVCDRAICVVASFLVASCNEADVVCRSGAVVYGLFVTVFFVASTNRRTRRPLQTALLLKKKQKRNQNEQEVTGRRTTRLNPTKEKRVRKVWKQNVEESGWKRNCERRKKKPHSAPLGSVLHAIR